MRHWTLLPACASMRCGCILLDVTLLLHWPATMRRHANVCVVKAEHLDTSEHCIYLGGPRVLLVQDLQQLPVLPAVLATRAAAATAAAAAHADAAIRKPCTIATAHPETAVDGVPAALVPLRLQPAKQAVYSAFHDQVQLH